NCAAFAHTSRVLRRAILSMLRCCRCFKQLEPKGRKFEKAQLAIGLVASAAASRFAQRVFCRVAALGRVAVKASLLDRQFSFHRVERYLAQPAAKSRCEIS